jgi:MSHA biogenesis protein MshQ
VTGVRTTSGNWKGTGWQLTSDSVPSNLTSNCFDNTNHNSSGTFTETFTIIAPATPGTTNAYFQLWGNDSCPAGVALTRYFTLANAITVDNTAPTVTSINRVGASPTKATSVSWTAQFSENVTGVDATDFALVQAGGVSGASITSVRRSASRLRDSPAATSPSPAAPPARAARPPGSAC